jgi:multimeric flavodoxin WrbA
MKKNNVLILNGSPKINNITSQSLTLFMENELNKKGVETKTIRVSTCIAGEQEVMEVMQCIRKADLLFLISPLYIDSLPYNFNVSPK